jgi:hypothetical protein
MLVPVRLRRVPWGDKGGRSCDNLAFRLANQIATHLAQADVILFQLVTLLGDEHLGLALAHDDGREPEIGGLGRVQATSGRLSRRHGGMQKPIRLLDVYHSVSRLRQL